MRRLLALSAVASLAAVNRLDTLLLYLPALLFTGWQLPDRRKGMALLVLGQLPLVMWELFSIIYYGFPFPNTAYAKLNTGIGGAELAVQGLFYLLNSLHRDPLTLLVIFTGGVAAAVFRDRKSLLITLGMLLYLFYTVKIGGDFMSGRFLTAPLFCGAAILVYLEGCIAPPSSALVKGGILAAVAAAGLMAPLPTFRIDQPASLSDTKRINDERAWYFPNVGLLSRSRYEPYPTVQGYQDGLAARAEGMKDFYVIPVNNIGVYGYYAGAGVHIIDQFGLADPLLARLPAEREINFYIGHFHRRVPAGYISTIYSHKDLFQNEDLGRYYQQLHLIVSGKLFSVERWTAIWKMNTGQFDSLIDTDPFRYPDLARSSLSRTNSGEVAQEFADSGIEVDLGQVVHDQTVKAELSGQASFEIEFRKGAQAVGRQDVYAAADGGLASLTITVPASAVQNGYDHIRVYPTWGQAPFKLAQLSLIP